MTATAAPATARERSGRFAGERRMVVAANYRRVPYWLGTAAWIVYFVAPVVPAWLIGQVFDEIQRTGTSARLVVLLVALAVAELAIIWGITVGHRVYMRGCESSKSLMRANVMHAQLASGGDRAGARSVPVGDILVRLRDDPFDMLFLLDNWVDLVGALLFSLSAGYFLVRIDPLAALASVGPLLLVGWANRAVAHLARRYRQRARAAASEVSDFLAAAFEASLTIKVAGAQPSVLARLAELNGKRSKAAIGDGMWNELIWSVNGTAADVFVGIGIVVAARGRLTAGEVSQFFAYLVGMAWVPVRIGNLVAGRRRYDVSAARMGALVAPPSPTGDPLVEHRTLPVLGGADVSPPVRPARVPLRSLEVRGLTVASRGLAPIDLLVGRGELVVVSGPVASGKSSLLRAVVGLLDADAGEVLWNGEPVADRAAFFVPPNTAYVAQVPRLFAESLADNLRLGHDLSDADLVAGIALAAFDADTAALPEGTATMIGARGVRLSGGQAQRAAGARAMAHRPELLVLDDLTSALDVDTERELWTRLAAAGFSVLAASNRPVALARADRVIDLAARR